MPKHSYHLDLEKETSLGFKVDRKIKHSWGFEFES